MDKKYYIIGVAGAGTSGLARLLIANGAKVSGSDDGGGDVMQALEQEGMIIKHRDGKIDNISDDLEAVIYTMAISQDDYELEKARQKGIKTMSFREALGKMTKNYKNLVCVAGTHGKTTTTAMVARVLEDCGFGVTALVGGEVAKWNSNVLIGGNDFFVLETDEYKNEFLNFQPNFIILTNIDYDHQDFYKTKDDYDKAFVDFIKQSKKPTNIIYLENSSSEKVLKKIFDNTDVDYIKRGDMNLDVSSLHICKLENGDFLDLVIEKSSLNIIDKKELKKGFASKKYILLDKDHNKFVLKIYEKKDRSRNQILDEVCAYKTLNSDDFFTLDISSKYDFYESDLNFAFITRFVDGVDFDQKQMIDNLEYVLDKVCFAIKKFGNIKYGKTKIANSWARGLLKLNIDDNERKLLDICLDMQIEGGFGFVHGDLHSGNILISDKKIYLLDYGNIEYLPIVFELAEILANCYGEKGEGLIYEKEYNFIINKFKEEFVNMIDEKEVKKALFYYCTTVGIYLKHKGYKEDGFSYLYIADLMYDEIKSYIDNYNLYPVQKEKIEYLKNKCPDLYGEHNREDAILALGIINILDGNLAKAEKTLNDYGKQGTKRRMEYLKNIKGTEIYSDYAHNPEKIRALITGLKERFPNKNITLVFEPHQYARVKNAFDEFVKSFDGVDKLYISDIYKVRDKEEDTKAVNSEMLVNAIKERTKNINTNLKDENVFFSGDIKNTLDKVSDIFGETDIIVIATAGYLDAEVRLLLSMH